MNLRAAIMSDSNIYIYCPNIPENVMFEAISYLAFVLGAISGELHHSIVKDFTNDGAILMNESIIKFLPVDDVEVLDETRDCVIYTLERYIELAKELISNVD